MQFRFFAVPNADLNFYFRSHTRLSFDLKRKVIILFNCMLGFYVGLALLRYCNLMVGILIGNFIMTMMSAGLLALGLKSSLQNVAAGLVILIIMIVTSNQGRISDYLAMKHKAKEIQKRISTSNG